MRVCSDVTRVRRVRPGSPVLATPDAFALVTSEPFPDDRGRNAARRPWHAVFRGLDGIATCHSSLRRKFGERIDFDKDAEHRLRGRERSSRP